MSAEQHIADFISFMESAGIVPSEEIAGRLVGGDLIRFSCEGDGKGRKNGWAILYLDARPAGAFGNYRMNTGTLKWKADSDKPALTPEERQSLREEWRKAKAKREQARADAQLEAARESAELLEKGQPADDHPYVLAKDLDPTHLRVVGGKLLIPMARADGKVWNVQRISASGEKKFMHGGRVDDTFNLIGQLPQGVPVAIVEGYATGDAVHKAVGCAVIVAFNTANLIKVARLFYNARPDLYYTIYADDDEATALKHQERDGEYKNPGIESARAAAREIGARVAYPLGRAQSDLKNGVAPQAEGAGA